jgi:uncharacterized membrane protein
MLKYVSAYLSTAIIFFVLDFIWLSMMATSFYRSRIPDIMASAVSSPRQSCSICSTSPASSSSL